MSEYKPNSVFCTRLCSLFVDSVQLMQLIGSLSMHDASSLLTGISAFALDTLQDYYQPSISDILAIDVFVLDLVGVLFPLSPVQLPIHTLSRCSNAS